MAPSPLRPASSWASCGAMQLTGDPGGPPLAIPWHEAPRLEATAAGFGLDMAMLGERAAAASLGRRGHFSCGGRTRLFRARDGWVALCLARDYDLDLLPALVGIEAAGREDAWAKLGPEIETLSSPDLEGRSELLGVCLSAVGASSGPMAARGKPRPAVRRRDAPVVVDLSAMWAGPLCAHLLQRAGARVIKVEDLSRPDGARGGVTRFFDLMNQEKLSVVLDFRSCEGRSHLVDLLGAADVVVTSARARAFDQLGIEVDDVLSAASDKVWTAITAYGWSSHRVGFGDDVAAGAGLVAWHPIDGEPRFAGDAIADPLCGLEAAALTLECLERGGRWFIDASLAGAATRAVTSGAAATMATSREGRWFFEDHGVEEPRARSPLAPARALGSDTEKVLALLARLA